MSTCDPKVGRARSPEPSTATGPTGHGWAAAWEFQALLKARPVAGDGDLGDGFADAASEPVWDRSFSADELAELRSMKARAEARPCGRGSSGREIKRGPGGIRDVEFSVQLLQLVHGHHDPTIRDRSTLGALAELRRRAT